jgi:squalene synthase HpnC
MLQSDQSTSVGTTFFARELARLGPDQPPTAWSLADSEGYCRRWAKTSYENFSVVSWLLPSRLRQDFYNVYAYCRWSDDLADEVPSPGESLRLLDWWQQQLALCYSGRPAHPVMVALQKTIRNHALPIDPLSDLLSAFRQDQTVLRYRDRAQLLDYCQRSANPVGRILLQLAGSANADTVSLSDQICTGLQLANFCQDMARDAAIGRIYAPEEMWQKHAVTEAMLLAGKPTRELKSLLKEWVSDARNLFDAGRPLIRRVPNWLATDVDLFLRGGVAVLDAIEGSEFDVWTERPVITGFQKVGFLLRSISSRFITRKGGMDG